MINEVNFFINGFVINKVELFDKRCPALIMYHNELLELKPVVHIFIVNNL